MSDDKTKTVQDRKLISLKETYEVQYWKEALKVSEKELRDAVKAVGNSAATVREHLKK